MELLSIYLIVVVQSWKSTTLKMMNGIKDVYSCIRTTIKLLKSEYFAIRIHFTGSLIDRPFSRYSEFYYMISTDDTILSHYDTRCTHSRLHTNPPPNTIIKSKLVTIKKCSRGSPSLRIYIRVFSSNLFFHHSSVNLTRNYHDRTY